MSRRPLMAGNWKMNLDHREAVKHVQELAFRLTPEQLAAVEVVVLPPFVDLRGVQSVVLGEKYGLVFGAQDLSPHDGGAHTGDVSGAMLARLGCTYVVVGHSERRADHGETDEVVRSKVAAAVRAGLVPVLCVGEGLEVRRADGQVAHCTGQLLAALDGLPAQAARTIVLAYEPVWAIGTGEVATPEDAQEVCSALRTALAERYPGELADGVRVLYGGSVKAANVRALLDQPDVDGALVGGASLDAEEFASICTLGR